MGRDQMAAHSIPTSVPLYSAKMDGEFTLKEALHVPGSLSGKRGGGDASLMGQFSTRRGAAMLWNRIFKWT